MRVTHAGELRPVISVKRVGRLGDDERLDPFPLHEKARSLAVHQRRVPF